MNNSPGRTLQRLAAKGTLQIPGVFNALVARMAQRHGFSAMYLSGAAFSAGTLGLPDVGLFTLTELVEETRKLTRACDLPLIVDADTGFGEAVNVERTVAELTGAGAAAIQLEDQQLPKKCGHLAGKRLVSTEEMCQKIRAAAQAKPDPDLVILARTDARGVTSLEEAIERAQQYVQAGADWIFPEALESREEFEQFNAQVPVPLVANMTEFGKSPLLALADFQQMGYAGVLYPVSMLRIAMKAVEKGLAELQASGTQQSLLEKMQTRQELYDLLDYTDLLERDNQHFQPPSKPSS